LENRDKILLAIIEFKNANGKSPTQTQLATKTGLSRRTVGTHLKAIREED
jgi:biotin operon repressor